MNNVLRINKSKTVSLNQELAINLVNHVNLQTDNRLLKFNNQVYMFKKNILCYVNQVNQ